jgi:hypothetical protein
MLYELNDVIVAGCGGFVTIVKVGNEGWGILLIVIIAVVGSVAVFSIILAICCCCKRSSKI